MNRYVVESEGNWTFRVRDTHKGIHYVARMLPQYMAESAAWMWNHVNVGHAVGVITFENVELYEGAYPAGYARP